MQAKRWASWPAVILLVCVGAVGMAASAQAAVPDRFGFALYTGGIVTERTPAATAVFPGLPGRYTVIFPGQGVPGGVVHVVAVQDGLGTPPGRWCQVDGWGVSGVDEKVGVSCYSPGGVLDPTAGFSVQFAASSGVSAPPGFYGYVHSTGAGVIVTQYNSVGGVDTVVHAGVGVYSVGFNGLGTVGPNDGSLQVTAVNPAAGARCKVAGWLSSPNGQFLRILCFNAAGLLADNTFTATYQYQRSLYGPAFVPFKFGYLWNVPALGPATTNYNSSGPVNILAGAAPAWTVAMPNIVSPPGNMQVTAYGSAPDFCTLRVPWVASGSFLVSRIACYTNAGTPSGSGFFASYNSLF